MLCAIFSRVKVNRVDRIKKEECEAFKIWTCQRQVVWNKAVFEVFFFQYSYEDSMKEQNLYAKFCFLVCDDVEPGKNIALFEWIRLDPFSTATQKMDSFETFF